MARPTLSQLCHARSRAAFRTADEAIRRAHLKHGDHLFEIDRALGLHDLTISRIMHLRKAADAQHKI